MLIWSSPRGLLPAAAVACLILTGAIARVAASAARPKAASPNLAAAAASPKSAPARPAASAIQPKSPSPGQSATAEPLPHFAPSEALEYYGRYLSDRLAAMVLRADESASPDPLPKISTHEHYRVGGDLDALFTVMDELNIRKVILVPTGNPPDNRGYREHMASLLEAQRRHPDRIIAYASTDTSDPQAPQILKQAIADGAKGLKLMDGHPEFYDAPLDNPVMRRLMAICQESHLPVLIHVQMGQFPQMEAEFERLLADFPDVTFVVPHYLEYAPDLSRVRAELDRFPNLYTDLSMGGGAPRYMRYINADPDEFRKFILDYQDRLLWGADIILSETKDESFVRSRVGQDLHLFRRRIHASPWAQFEVPLRGLQLPEPLLRKLYWENPWKILGERALGSRAEAEAGLPAPPAAPNTGVER